MRKTHENLQRVPALSRSGYVCRATSPHDYVALNAELSCAAKLRCSAETAGMFSR